MGEAMRSQSPTQRKRNRSTEHSAMLESIHRKLHTRCVGHLLEWLMPKAFQRIRDVNLKFNSFHLIFILPDPLLRPSTSPFFTSPPVLPPISLPSPLHSSSSSRPIRASSL